MQHVKICNISFLGFKILQCNSFICFQSNKNMFFFWFGFEQKWEIVRGYDVLGGY